MGLFGSSSNVRYGAIIDIGSGSVLAAVIASEDSKSEPEILWLKREYTPLRNTGSLRETAKGVMTSLLNVLMLLNKDGKRALFEKKGIKKLNQVQVSIAAPWSYTVTKTISYNHDNEFEISEELITELLRTAHSKVEEELKENERIHNLGLDIIARSVISIEANGYTIKKIDKQRAKTLRIVESNAVAQKYLLDNLNEVKDKILPYATTCNYSFILLYYYIFRSLYPDIEECCLIDITYEATEVGIVRGGILAYCTHTPYGGASLAREIASALEIPLEQAMIFIREATVSDWLSDFSETKQNEVKTIFHAYQDKLEAAMKETGDTLAIPKKIYIHGNLGSEEFFKSIVKEAAYRATKSSHAVYSFSDLTEFKRTNKQTIDESVKPQIDTSLYISAKFFHMKELSSRFEQV